MMTDAELAVIAGYELLLGAEKVAPELLGIREAWVRKHSKRHGKLLRSYIKARAASTRDLRKALSAKAAEKLNR